MKFFKVDPYPSSATDPNRRYHIRMMTALVGLTVFSLSCAAWWANTPRHITDIAAILKCVGEKADQGKLPKDIAIECGLENADQVIDLLRQQRELETKHAKATSSASATPTASTSASTSTAASAKASTSPCK